jgi:hypothetical protein
MPADAALGPGPVVDDPAEITPAWMTEALRVGGVDTEVTGLRLERIGNGMLGANYRVHLEHRSSSGAPASVVVKMAAGPKETRDFVKAGYRTEVGFYRLFATRAGIRTPRCWSAGISSDLLEFTLVMDDAGAAVPGRQVDGCTPAQATAAVRNLAGLHAPFWNQHELNEGLDWLRSPTGGRLGYFSQVFARGVEDYITRFSGALPAEDTETLHQLAELLPEWNAHLRDRVSLIHGDYRLDNLLFAGDEPTAVDWQTLELGLPGRDLGYFLGTALPPEQRRAQEQALVAAYHQRLAELGVEDYPPDLCFHDYRIGVVQAPVITILGCVYSPGESTPATDAMFLSMSSNACTALRDLGTLDLLATPART